MNLAPNSKRETDPGSLVGEAPADRSPEGRPRFRSRAWKIAGIYAGFATVWIYFSDRALGLLVPQPELLVKWSVLKGLGFVAITTGLLLLLMRRALGAVELAFSEVVRHEAEIERLKRLYQALSQINQAIVRLPTQDALFRKICQVLVEHGRFRMAWIGWHAVDKQQIEPVASFGDDAGYLQQIRIYTDDRPEAKGPTGVAFREERSYVCNDLLRDPASSPWRDEAKKRGYRASAVFPIRKQGVVRGTLNVYAGEVGFFQDKEVALLEEASVDLSFALENLLREEERRPNEQIARDERLLSETIIESLPGVFYFFNEDGRILRWNRDLEVKSGYSGSEIARMHPLEFVGSEDRKSLAVRTAEVFALGESASEASFLARDGSATPYFFTGKRVEINGSACLVGVGIDLTKRKRAELALRELNETLEKKVMERTAELQAALVRAEGADRTKSMFLATMSHELRTPLNSIIGFTGIILQGLAGPLTTEQTKQLTMVRGSARQLLELINDVLDLSKIEAGQLEIRHDSFDLRVSLERVSAVIQPLAAKKGLSLTLAADPGLTWIVSDRRRVEQILLNLLHNAVKFTERGGVTLTTGIVAPEAVSVDGFGSPAMRLSVTDSGIGISAENLVTLFQPFRQIDSGLSRRHEGTGLGLAICRHLATLLGGKISAVSDGSTGTSFTVILPLVKPVET